MSKKKDLGEQAVLYYLAERATADMDRSCVNHYVTMKKGKVVFVGCPLHPDPIHAVSEHIKFSPSS